MSKYVTNSITIKEFIELYCSKEISPAVYSRITGFDEETITSTKRQYSSNRYQRRFGRWSHPQKCSYISSIFFGMIVNPIVVAEISERARLLDEPGKQVKFASVDGQHRSCIIAEFVNNEVGYTGPVHYDGKTEYYTNEYFKSLPTRAQERFLSRCYVNVCALPENANVSKTFIKINSGVALNDQEIRNAIDTYIAGWTRRMSESFKRTMSKVSGAKWENMDDCVLLAQLALVFSNLKQNKALDNASKSLNAFYYKGEEKDISSYDQEVLDYIESRLLPALRAVIGSFTTSRKISKREMWAFATLHREIFLSDKVPSFSDLDLFNYAAVNLYEFDKASRADMSNDEKKLSSSNFSKSDYFHYSTRHLQYNNTMVPFRKKFIDSYNGDIKVLLEQVKEFAKPEERLAAK